MKEINGELWDYYNKACYRICLTVNGTIKANGESVMGRGCALEATKKFPDIALTWGQRLKQYGLRFMYLHEFDLFMFPVKYNWWEPASLKLIRESALDLEQSARSVASSPFTGSHTREKIILPRPGCGNGRLSWEEVKPIIQFLPDNVLVISK